MHETLHPNTWLSKIIVLFYRLIMPIITIISFLYISSNIPRSIIGSIIFDLLSRITLCVIFCLGYFFMPYISKDFWYFDFPGIKKSKVIISPGSVFQTILMIMIRFMAFGVLTKISIDIFLPNFNNLALVMSFINGLLFALPALAQFLSLRSGYQIKE